MVAAQPGSPGFHSPAREMQPLINRLNAQLQAHAPKTLPAPPTSVDLRQWCSPIEDQEQARSCTANAAAGVIEYFERQRLRPSCGRVRASLF